MTSLQINSNGLILNIEIDENTPFGMGARVPHLIVPVRFQTIRIEGEPDINFEVTALYCDLSCKIEQRDEIIGSSVPCLLANFARNLTSQQLMFPLDHARLALLESARSGGENLSLFLNLRLGFRKLRRLDGGQTYSHVMESFAFCQGWLTVPRSTWCERVLPNAGFGTVQVVEFPAVPVEQCQGLKNAFASLQEAQRLHRLGFYDKAVGECRVALDKFWDDRPKRLKDSWVVKLGQINHKWLNDALTELRRAANDPHHTSIGRHYDQLESQLFIAITTAFVALVARSGVSE
jgi:hypothetical protein